MRHLRSDYAAIQPWPVKRAHNGRVHGHVALDIDVSGVTDDQALPGLTPLIPDDEPVFLLRGQDPAASVAVRAYAIAAAAAGADAELVRSVGGWADEMKAYAAEARHGAPDVPAGMLPAAATPEPAVRWLAVVSDNHGFVLTDEDVRGWCAAMDEGKSGWAIPCEDPQEVAIVTGSAMPRPQSEAPDETIFRRPGSWTSQDVFLEIDVDSEEPAAILRIWERVQATAAAMNALAVQ